jgi:hypothetical protein
MGLAGTIHGAARAEAKERMRLVRVPFCRPTNSPRRLEDFIFGRPHETDRR